MNPAIHCSACYIDPGWVCSSIFPLPRSQRVWNRWAVEHGPSIQRPWFTWRTARPVEAPSASFCPTLISTAKIVKLERREIEDIRWAWFCCPGPESPELSAVQIAGCYLETTVLR